MKERLGKLNKKCRKILMKLENKLFDKYIKLCLEKAKTDGLDASDLDTLNSVTKMYRDNLSKLGGK